VCIVGPQLKKEREKDRKKEEIKKFIPRRSFQREVQTFFLG
jgi:hypothetical protein